MRLTGLLVLLPLVLASCVDSAPDPQPQFTVQNQALTTAEYPLATWVTSPNFNVMSRKPPDVTVIVIHTTQGTYQSAISWFQDTAAQASAHYVISKKGEITQMVLEKDKAWHVGSENKYTIGIEHEGMIDDPTWVTEPMLDASAKLCCYLLKKWQLPATKDHIKGHVELPNQTHTDPGQYWPWDTYLTKVQACMAETTPDCGSCDDKNVCTQDTCVAGACAHTPATGGCDDGDACTVGDYCAQGLCLSGASTGCGSDATSGADVADGKKGPPDAAGLQAPPDAGDASAGDAAADLAQPDAAPLLLPPAAPQSAASACSAGSAGDPRAVGAAFAVLALTLLRRRRA